MSMQIRNLVNQMLRPLKNRVYTLVSRAIIESVNDSKNLQVVKLNLLAGEDRSDVERFQNFGFTSNPPDGSECVAIAMGGNRDHLIVLAADDRRVRVKDLGKGESAIYTNDGTLIHLKAGGVVEIKSATKVDIDAPLVEIGDGTLEKILNGETFQTYFNTHQHLGNAGVPTGPPITPSDPSHLSDKVKAAK